MPDVEPLNYRSRWALERVAEGRVVVIHNLITHRPGWRHTSVQGNYDYTVNGTEMLGLLRLRLIRVEATMAIPARVFITQAGRAVLARR